MALRGSGDKWDGFLRKGQAWFCNTELASDVTVEVEEMLFHLHKFPLMSRSGKLTKLVTEASRDDGKPCLIRLQRIPGGPEAFELAAKFAYGIRVELVATNVAAIRCAAEYLEMTEEYGEGNLLGLSETFLNQVVLKSWKDSVRALKSCEALLPLAEQLLIVKKCVESITMKASTDPNLFGWPMMEKCSLQSPAGTVLWNGISAGARPKSSKLDWWYDDVSALNLPLFKCVISSMEEKGLRREPIAGALMFYAKKFLPGLNRRQDGALRATVSSLCAVPCEAEQRLLLETIESLLPSQDGLVTTRFLFGLLRTTMILKASQACRVSLERRIGAQLEQASLEDLVIPNYSYSSETLYDIDCVQRILDHFLLSGKAIGAASATSPLVEQGQFMASPLVSSLVEVAKLVDGYLAEVGSDENLKTDKFLSLAGAVPACARLLDDGLYRAIDIYLKAHSWMAEEERERLCGVMDCRKLSLEACSHAAQNERLPLRMVIQVLFFEQLQLRTAITGNVAAGKRDGGGAREEEEAIVPSLSRGGVCSAAAGWVAAARENQALRLDMASMVERVADLERECGRMRRQLRRKAAVWAAVSAKMGCAELSDAVEPPATPGSGRRSVDKMTQSSSS